MFTVLNGTCEGEGELCVSFLTRCVTRWPFGWSVAVWLDEKTLSSHCPLQPVQFEFPLSNPRQCTLNLSTSWPRPVTQTLRCSDNPASKRNAAANEKVFPLKFRPIGMEFNGSKRNFKINASFGNVHWLHYFELLRWCSALRHCLAI